MYDSECDAESGDGACDMNQANSDGVGDVCTAAIPTLCEYGLLTLTLLLLGVGDVVIAKGRVGVA